MAQSEKSKSNTSAPSQEELAEQINQIKDDIGTLTRMMVDYAADTESKAEDALRQKASAARAQGRDAMHAAEVQANAFVAERPGMALGIAAGLGFLIGAWGSRR